MIPNSASPVQDRFPDEIGTPFTALPEALGDVAGQLGLTPHSLLVIWALERHRRRRHDVVWPSLERLAELTCMSTHQVKRATADLVSAGLLTRTKSRSGVSIYDLEPLWQAVATAHQCTKGESSSEPQRTGALSHSAPVHEPQRTSAPEKQMKGTQTNGKQNPFGAPASAGGGHTPADLVEAIPFRGLNHAVTHYSP